MHVHPSSLNIVSTVGSGGGLHSRVGGKRRGTQVEGARQEYFFLKAKQKVLQPTQTPPTELKVKQIS